MNVDQRETVRTLNSLVRLNKDSELGSKTVAEHASNRWLKVLLKHQAQQRSQFALELQNARKRVGAVPYNGGSPLATVHRR